MKKSRFRLTVASLAAGVVVGLMLGTPGPTLAAAGEVSRCCTIPPPPPCNTNPLMCA
jgi:hypothetical protein